MESTAPQDQRVSNNYETNTEVSMDECTPITSSEPSSPKVAVQTHLAKVGFFASAVAVAAWTARMAFDPRSQRFAMTFPDSFDYFDVARLGPLRFGEFFFGRRPFGYPLFIWALGVTPGRVVTVQVILYALAWLYLITTVLRIWRSKVVAGITALILLLLGLLPKYSVWSVNTLSEGLALTSTVAAVGAWLRWAAWPDRRRVITVTIMSLAWISLRDSNAVNILVVGGAVFGILMLRWFLGKKGSTPTARPTALPTVPPTTSVTPEAQEDQQDQQDQEDLSKDSVAKTNVSSRALLRGQPLAMALVALLGFSLYQLVSQTVSQRGRYSTFNTIGRDVLPNPELSKYFFEHGMPNPPALAARTGKDSWADGPDSWLLNPQLAGFRKWADSEGRKLVARALIVKSPVFWNKLTHDWKTYNGDGSRDYDTLGAYGRTPSVPGRHTLISLSFTNLLFSCLGGFGIAIALANSRRDLRMAILGGLLSLAAVFDIYVCYVGDADERYRHIISGYLRLDLAALLAVSWAMDRVICRLTTLRANERLGTATT